MNQNHAFVTAKRNQHNFYLNDSLNYTKLLRTQSRRNWVFMCHFKTQHISTTFFFLVQHNFVTNSRIETKLRQPLTFSIILPPWKFHLITSTTQLFTANQSWEANFRIFMWSAPYKLYLQAISPSFLHIIKRNFYTALVNLKRASVYKILALRCPLCELLGLLGLWW